MSTIYKGAAAAAVGRLRLAG